MEYFSPLPLLECYSYPHGCYSNIVRTRVKFFYTSRYAQIHRIVQVSLYVLYIPLNLQGNFCSRQCSRLHIFWSSCKLLQRHCRQYIFWSTSKKAVVLHLHRSSLLNYLCIPLSDKGRTEPLSEELRMNMFEIKKRF